MPPSSPPISFAFLLPPPLLVLAAPLDSSALEEETGDGQGMLKIEEEEEREWVGVGYVRIHGHTTKHNQCIYYCSHSLDCFDSLPYICLLVHVFPRMGRRPEVGKGLERR